MSKKFIISESQYYFLTEDYRIRLRRRLSQDNIKPYIEVAEMNFPTLCDDFGDEFDYADNVIRDAIDEFLTQDDEFIDSIGDEYDEVHSYVTDIVKDWYGEHLFEIYRMTCREEDYN